MKSMVIICRVLGFTVPLGGGITLSSAFMQAVADSKSAFFLCSAGITIAMISVLVGILSHQEADRFSI